MGFNDFPRNASNNLPNVVDNVKKDFMDISNEFFSISDKLNSEHNREHLLICIDNLDLYAGFAESFHDLVDYFSQSLDFERMKAEVFKNVTGRFMNYVAEPNMRA